MAKKEIANEDWTSERTAQGGWSPADHSAITWNETLAQKLKANDKKAIVDKIKWVVSAGLCSYAGHTHSSPGQPVTDITATAEKVKGDDKFVVRKDDEGVCQGQFTNNISGAVVTCACKFKVSDAGQTKFLAS